MVDRETVTVEDINNKEILDEVNAAQSWFHAKKVKPIWAKLVESAQVVETLEGSETVQAGDYLCRGIQDEVWPQSADSLAKKYDATDEVDAEGWRKYAPKADAVGVSAAQVPHAFKVQASWGELSGKANDFILKSHTDTDTKYPQDVWIVDQDLFHATYERVD